MGGPRGGPREGGAPYEQATHSYEFVGWLNEAETCVGCMVPGSVEGLEQKQTLNLFWSLPDSGAQILNFKPYTLNPQPSALNPQPSTLNPNPQTPNSKPE